MPMPIKTGDGRQLMDAQNLSLPGAAMIQSFPDESGPAAIWLGPAFPTGTMTRPKLLNIQIHFKGLVRIRFKFAGIPIKANRDDGCPAGFFQRLLLKPIVAFCR